MSAFLDRLGSALVGSFGQLSLELALLAAAALLAGRVLRGRSPALRHFLWVAVLLKPIVAVVVSSQWTVFTPLASLAPAWHTSGYSISGLGAGGVAALPPTADGGVLPLTSAGWAAALWALGAALLLGRIAIGYSVAWRLRRRARICEVGPLYSAFRKARGTLEVRPEVQVAASRAIRAPMVLGILRPLIVLPTDLPDRLHPDELDAILMHELAHVRRYDNLTLLVQRLVAAALFFHPAVWLCGHMLQREAEQACDDLVILSTGRSEPYARGLTSVAELADLKIDLKERIPIMNVSEATESDLAQRIRRAIAGRARRMSPRSRVLAALLLCGVCAVVLPSVGLAGDEDGIDWEVVKTTAPEDWPAELQDQLVAAGYDVDAVAGRVRLGLKQDQDREETTWREAMATDPDEWSEELKARILELKPGSAIEEIAEAIRQRQRTVRHGKTDLEEIGRKLRAAVQAGEMTPEEAREKMQALRRRLAAAGEGSDDELEQLKKGIIERAMAQDPEEWNDEMKAAIVRVGWDLDEFTEAIRQRQQAMRDGDPEVGDGERRIRAFELKIRQAVEAGEMTPEEGRAKMEAARRRLSGASSDDLDARTRRLDALGRRLRAAVEAGDMTPEEARERMQAIRQRLAASDGDGDTRLREFQRGVASRAMAGDPAKWSDELKSAIARAGWDVDALAERVRQAQAEGESPDLSDFGFADTAIQQRSWGQIKAEIAGAE